MKRRRAVVGLAGIAAAGLGASFWPDQGLWNSCAAPDLPGDLADGDLIRDAWQGIDSAQVWDCHAHLIGVGDNGGTWINPAMDRLSDPMQYAQKRFFLNAGCADSADGKTDASYLARLLRLRRSGLRQAKIMLLAFDYTYSQRGERLPNLSAFHTANEYAAAVAQRYPNDFEWIASVHPYRPDAIAALQWVKQHGARAIKWLPASMGIDPATAQCKPFYRALAELRLPLLSHAGEERAVHGAGSQELGNPLLLRHALDEGAYVIVAHCASMGESRDLDAGPNAALVGNFELFARLMAEARYANRLFGDVSAVTQANRAPIALQTLLERDDWHPRLLNGSDYPLPGVMPLFSLTQLERLKLLDPQRREVLTEIRKHNALLFDFVLKRSLRSNGHAFSANVFETRRFFERLA